MAMSGSVVSGYMVQIESVPILSYNIVTHPSGNICTGFACGRSWMANLCFVLDGEPLLGRPDGLLGVRPFMVAAVLPAANAAPGLPSVGASRRRMSFVYCTVRLN